MRVRAFAIAAFGLVLQSLRVVAAPTGVETLRAGTVTLHHCETTAAWCGTLLRPLDPSGAVPGSISVYFEFYPRTGAAQPVGTLVATEGGPGSPATGSRDEYLGLFAPLRATRDVLIMDNRGTGHSDAINCVALQTDPAATDENIAGCGRSLGVRAPFYSTAYAADDLAAIIDALSAGRVDLYGDSYGTFFVQVFALRHHQRLRSVILDGAYPLDGQDYAWYPNYAPAMRDKFNLTCQRSAACRSFPGNSLDHIAPALQSLRAHPFTATARDGEGRERRFTADASHLAAVMFGSAPAYASVRELDAAARAFVADDRAPLLRLMAETSVSLDSRDATRSPALFSAGLAIAVNCQDAPQIFDMSLPPEARLVARERVIAQRKRTQPQTYGPFTIDEYRGMPLDYTFIDQCAAWPAESRFVVDAALRSQAYPDVPALVISGDLDNLTPLADGTVAARRFPHGRQVIVPNGFHVNALPRSRSECPARIARRFIESLTVTETACLQSVPEVRLVGRFARRASELPPAAAGEGNAANEQALRVVSAAVSTVGDVIDRIESNSTGSGVGLRGGTFSIVSADAGDRLTLHEVRWTEDVSVSGTVTWPGRSGAAAADLVVAGPGVDSASLKIQWSEGVPEAQARIRGNLGRTAVVAKSPAP